MNAPRPYTLAGSDVMLAARRPRGRVLVVYLGRDGRPTDRFHEVEAMHLRRIGTHLHDIKQAIAALPERLFPFDPPQASAEPVPPKSPPPPDRDTTREGRFLHAHHAIPEGDR